MDIYHLISAFVIISPKAMGLLRSQYGQMSMQPSHTAYTVQPSYEHFTMQPPHHILTHNALPVWLLLLPPGYRKAHLRALQITTLCKLIDSWRTGNTFRFRFHAEPTIFPTMRIIASFTPAATPVMSTTTPSPFMTIPSSVATSLTTSMTFFMTTTMTTTSTTATTTTLVTSTSLSTTTSTQSICSGQKDVIFVLDSSGSVTETNWPRVLNFTVEIVNAFPISTDEFRVGVVSFGGTAQSNIFLNSFTDLASLTAAIFAIPFDGTTTNTAAALQLVMDEQLLAVNGDRADVPNTVILLTDGPSNDAGDTLTSAQMLQGVAQIFSVGVFGASPSEVQQTSSPPQQLGRNYYLVESFDDINAVADPIVTEACAA